MLTIKNGTVYLYYCFDVAYEIALDNVQTVFGTTPATAHLVCERLHPGYMKHKHPPLLVRLGKEILKAGTFLFDCDVKAKLYDFGVITIMYQFPLVGTLEHVAKLTRELNDNALIADQARQHIKSLVTELRSVMTKSHETFEYWEDYLVVRVHDFGKAVTGQQVLKTHGTAICAALRCEPETLSPWELENAIKYPLSYYDNELVIVDWAGAFVYDPRITYDVQDVLEYAVIELLELRAYDHILDTTLEQTYGELEKKSGFSLVPYGATMNHLIQVKLDVSEVLDKLTDQLKLTGDLYLAKVYRAAAQRFYLDSLKAALHDKLEAVESIYTMLLERANNRSLMITEAFMLFLFVAELVLLAAWFAFDLWK